MERPQLSGYVGDYCKECATKWSRCICRPESDLQNYTVRTQMDNPSNVENNSIQYHQIGAIRKTSGMIKHLKSYHLLDVNTDVNTFPTKLTLIGMTIFTHRTTGQNLNLRHLLGNHYQDCLKEWGYRASLLLLQAQKIILTLTLPYLVKEGDPQ